MTRAIELSCDLGEAADPEGRAVEEALWPLIGAANVACGGHAGDERSMRDAAVRAARHGVVLGAHPSYPDRDGFGRRRIEIAPDRLRASLIGQLEALRRAAALSGVAVRRVKPHGALYNEAVRDAELAAIVAAAVAAVDPALEVVAQPESRLIDAARRCGLPVVREAFADRGYAPDGSLLPRSDPRSLLLDPADAAAQALRLAREGRVATAAGEVPVAFETICVHGDMEGAVARLRAIRAALEREGFALAAAGTAR